MSFTCLASETLPWERGQTELGADLVCAELQSLLSWVTGNFIPPCFTRSLGAGRRALGSPGSRPDPNPEIPSDDVGSPGAEPSRAPAPSCASGCRLQTQTHTLPRSEFPRPEHPRTHPSRALATALLRSQPPRLSAWR